MLNNLLNNNCLSGAGIVSAVDPLAELAKLINAEHEAGELAPLEHYRRAGELLLEAKGQCQYGDWLSWLEANVRFGKSRAYQYMEFAKVPVNWNFQDQWSEWQRISGNIKPEDDEPDGDGGSKKKTPKVAHNTGNNEWNTPPEFIAAARDVLGTIDLDPATSEIAQEIVQAETYYTKQDNGLTKPWSGRVWMNPPYSANLIGSFVEKLCEHFFKKDVSQAIVLVNDAMETAWAQELSDHASAVCFPFHRVKFLGPDGNPGSGPLQGQALFYLGGDMDLFRERFAEFGRSWRK
jgi:ParB family chromosome partitioning protein